MYDQDWLNADEPRKRGWKQREAVLAARRSALLEAADFVRDLIRERTCSGQPADFIADVIERELRARAEGEKQQRSDSNSTEGR